MIEQRIQANLVQDRFIALIRLVKNPAGDFRLELPQIGFREPVACAEGPVFADELVHARQQHVFTVFEALLDRRRHSGERLAEKVEHTDDLIDLLFDPAHFKTQVGERGKFLLEAQPVVAEARASQLADERLGDDIPKGLAESGDLRRLEPNALIEARAADRLRVSRADGRALEGRENHSGFRRDALELGLAIIHGSAAKIFWIGDVVKRHARRQTEPWRHAPDVVSIKIEALKIDADILMRGRHVEEPAPFVNAERVGRVARQTHLSRKLPLLITATEHEGVRTHLHDLVQLRGVGFEVCPVIKVERQRTARADLAATKERLQLAAHAREARLAGKVSLVQSQASRQNGLIGVFRRQHLIIRQTAEKQKSMDARIPLVMEAEQDQRGLLQLGEVEGAIRGGELRPARVVSLQDVADLQILILGLEKDACPAARAGA